MRSAAWLRRNLTYANVVATIALFGVLGGGAYAISTKAPPDSVGSKAIIDGAVKSADVKDGSLTGADIDQSTLSGGGGTNGGPPSGPAGGDLTGNYPKPQIAGNTIGPSNLRDGAVTATKVGEIISVERDDVAKDVVAKCPAGTQLISGGATVTTGEGLTDSYGQFGDANQWVAGTDDTAHIFTSANCLEG